MRSARADSAIPVVRNVRDRTTAESFALPPSTITNGLGGAWEYRRGGYSLVTNGTWYRRRSGEQVIRAQEEERRRVARELHDDLNQRLALLGLRVVRFSWRQVTAEPRYVAATLDGLLGDRSMST